MAKTDQGYKNLAKKQAFTFDEALYIAGEVFDAYGSSMGLKEMNGNMICELVNLAAERAMRKAVRDTQSSNSATSAISLR